MRRNLDQSISDCLVSDRAVIGAALRVHAAAGSTMYCSPREETYKSDVVILIWIKNGGRKNT